MSRRRNPKPRLQSRDPIYKNILLYIFVTRLMRHGKKSRSYHLMYSTLEQIYKRTKREPLEIIENATRIVTPTVHLKSRRVGGTTYQIPVEVGARRGTIIAITWILHASRQRPERNMVIRLSAEIMDSARGIGASVRKRETIHRRADANKSFVRYRF
jgi:small subunit ribosomal protein S7